MIFSWKHEEIAKAIVEETEHALTILDGHGWYTGKDVKVICLMAKRRESQSIFRIVKIIDPLAFVFNKSNVFFNVSYSFQLSIFPLEFSKIYS